MGRRRELVLRSNSSRSLSAVVRRGTECPCPGDPRHRSFRRGRRRPLMPWGNDAPPPLGKGPGSPRSFNLRRPLPSAVLPRLLRCLRSQLFRGGIVSLPRTEAGMEVVGAPPSNDRRGTPPIPDDPDDQLRPVLPLRSVCFHGRMLLPPCSTCLPAGMDLLGERIDTGLSEGSNSMLRSVGLDRVL